MICLAINGSERTGGATSYVIDEFLRVMRGRGWESRRIDLAEREVLPCRCGSCNSRPDPCDVDDDVRWIVDQMVAADGIVLASPVHGFGLAAPMQLFIERAGVGVLRFGRPLTNKLGAAVVVGRRYSLSDVHAQLVNNLLLNRLIVVGSGFPAAVQTGGPSGAASDEEGMDAVARTASRMADVGLALHAANVTLPHPDGTELRVGRTG